MKLGFYYLNEVPATIGENGEKIFRKGRKIAKPEVVKSVLPEDFRRSFYERYNQFLN